MTISLSPTGLGLDSHAEWYGSARNGADPCGMVWIRAEWCGSVRTGVESVLVRAESAESAQSVRIRVEHQGECKLLPSGSLSSNGTSSTNHSGYGVLIDRPTVNMLPATTEELDQLRQGHILSPKDGRYAPLPPPPRLIYPELVQQTPLLERPLFKPQTSHLKTNNRRTIAEDNCGNHEETTTKRRPRTM